MKYYLEYPTAYAAKKRIGEPTVLAFGPRLHKFTDRGGNACINALCTATDCRSQFTWMAIVPAYLKSKCRRVSEDQARIIHPEIFNCGLL